MDETKTRWYRWVGNHASYFFWLGWGGLAGLFGSNWVGVLEKPSEAIIATFTAVLALSTIGLWRVTGSLAEATQLAVDDARQKAERELRAYVTITKHRALDYRLEIGNLIIPCVTIKNVGKTPANNMRVALSAKIDFAHVAEIIQLDDEPGTPFTLAPGEKTIFTADLPVLDRELVEALTVGTKAIFLLARIDYLDVFDRPCWTRMRASSVGVKKVALDGSIQLEWYGEDNDLT